MIESKGKKRWAYVLLFFMIYTLFIPLFEMTGGENGRVHALEESEVGLTGMVFAGGAGTQENPYQIETPEQLDQIRNHLDRHFILTRDINLDVAPYNTGEG